MNSLAEKIEKIGKSVNVKLANELLLYVVLITVDVPVQHIRFIKR